MTIKVPPVTEYYRSAIGKECIFYHGETVNVPTAGRIRNIEMPARKEANLLALQVRITVNTSAQQTTATGFNDAFMTEVFEDFQVNDDLGKPRIQFRDSHVMKNFIVAMNDNLIITPLGRLTSSASAVGLTEKFWIPLCLESGTSDYWPLEIETGTINNLYSTGTNVAFVSATMDLTYIYTKHPIIPFSIVSKTHNLIAGLNSLNSHVGIGPTAMVVCHSDNDVLWDYYYPYQNAVTNIDDIEIVGVGPNKIQWNVDGYSAFMAYRNQWLREYHTFFPVEAAATDLWPKSLKKNGGHYSNDLIISFEPPCFFAKDMTYDIEATTADAAFHTAQVLVVGELTYPPAITPPVPELEQGGTPYPSDSNIAIVNPGTPGALGGTASRRASASMIYNGNMRGQSRRKLSIRR